MHAQMPIGASLMSALLTATDAAARTLKKYGAEAGWDNIVREETGPGCLLAKKLIDTTQFEMGIGATAERRVYIAFYTKTDAEVSAGERISVLFEVKA